MNIIKRIDKGPYTDKTIGITGPENDQNFTEIEQEFVRIEEKIDAFSDGDGKTYQTLVAAMAVDPLPGDNIPFKVVGLTPSVDDGYYIYMSTEVSGYVKLPLEILKKASGIEENNPDLAVSGDVADAIAVETAARAAALALKADKTEIQPIKDAIGFEKETDYPLDFSLLTLSANNANINANIYPLTIKGKLNDFRIEHNTVGTLVEVYACVLDESDVLNIVYTYPTFNTTSVLHTQTFTDDFEIPVGGFVGVRASGAGLKYRNLTNGSRRVTKSTFNNFEFAFDFSIVSADGLIQKTDAIKIISDKNKVDIGENEVLYGESELISYTLTATGDRILTNNLPFLNDSILRDFTVKTITGATITPKVCTIEFISSGAIVKIIKEYDSYINTGGELTKTIEDDFIIPKGAFLGYTSDLGYYYKNLTTSSYLLRDYNNYETSLTLQGFEFGYNFNCTEFVEGKILQKINETTEEVVNLKSCILFNDRFQDLSNFTAVNWGLVSKGVSPTDVGSANSLFLNKKYNVNIRKYSFNLTLKSDSIFRFDFKGSTASSYPVGSCVFEINVTANTLNLYSRAGSATLTLAKTVTPTVTLVADVKYLVEISKNDWDSSIKITNANTLEVVGLLEYRVLTNSYNSEPALTDYLWMYLESGVTSGVILENITIASKFNPLLMILGNSITVGYVNSVANFDSIYSYAIRNLLKGDVLVSARAGQTINDVLEKITNECQFIKPKYAMLTIGTNGSNTVINLTTAIDTLISYGITPIINHIPAMNGGGHVAINAIIDEAVKLNGAVLGAKFDVATSIDNDVSLGILSSLFFDGIHPKISGYDKMTERVVIDCPYLFD